MIWKIWKKEQLNSEMMKIWKKPKLNSEKIQKKIVKRYGKYEKKRQVE